VSEGVMGGESGESREKDDSAYARVEIKKRKRLTERIRDLFPEKRQKRIKRNDVIRNEDYVAKL